MKRIFRFGALLMAASLFARCEYSRATRLGNADIIAKNLALPRERHAVRVEDENGRAVRGAIIVVERNAPRQDQPKIEAVKANARGRFAFTTKYDDFINLLAWAPGHAISSGQMSATNRLLWKRAHPGKPLPLIRLTLHAIAPVKLRLLDENGRPIAGAMASLNFRRNRAEKQIGYRGESMPIPDRALRAFSDADGYVTLAFGAKGDDISVNLEKRGFQNLFLHRRVGAAAPPTIRMKPGAVVRGRLLRAATGEPLANVVLGFEAGMDWPPPLRATTDANGYFKFDTLSEKPGFLQMPSGVTTPLRLIAPRRVSPTELGNVTVSPGALVRGTVRGMPVGVQIIVTPAGTTRGGVASWMKRANPDNDGRYRVRLPPGTFTLSAQITFNAGVLRQASPPQTITVKEGETRTVNFTVSPAKPRRR